LSPGTAIVPDKGAAGRAATNGIAERRAASSGIERLDYRNSCRRGWFGPYAAAERRAVRSLL
jgi:hypothetical protein